MLANPQDEEVIIEIEMSSLQWLINSFSILIYLGLWIGLITGSILGAIAYSGVVLRIKWPVEVEKVSSVSSSLKGMLNL